MEANRSDQSEKRVRRSFYRANTREVRIKKEAADRMMELFPTLSGLPRKLEMLLEYYEATCSEHAEEIPPLLQKIMNTPREVCSMKHEHSKRVLRKKQGEVQENSLDGEESDEADSDTEEDNPDMSIEEEDPLKPASPIAEALTVSGGSITVPTADDPHYKQLRVACQEGNLRSCKEAIKLVEEPDVALNASGASALWIVAETGNINLLEVILKESLDPNKATLKGVTPLSIAASKGHSSVVNTLLGDKRVDPNILDHQGHSTMYFALQGNHFKIMFTLIRDANYKVTPKDYEMINRRKNSLLTTLLYHNKPPTALSNKDAKMITRVCEASAVDS